MPALNEQMRLNVLALIYQNVGQHCQITDKNDKMDATIYMNAVERHFKNAIKLIETPDSNIMGVK